MWLLNENMRNFFAQKAEFLLTTNSQIEKLDFSYFSGNQDKGEGAVVLSALANSNSLPSITYIKCSQNESWWSEGKESNVELLSNAIRAMTNLKYLDLYFSCFSSEAFTEIMNAIVANQE